MFNNYDVSVQLDPSEQRLSAQVNLTCQMPETGRLLEFFLHRDLELSAVEGGRVAGFSKLPKPFTFAPDSVTWVVELTEDAAAGSTVDLVFTYSGILASVIPEGWHVNRLTPEWVELGLYGPWFPWNTDYGLFTYQVQVDIDPQYTVVGLGQTSKQHDGWLITSTEPVEDIVLTASKSFNRVAVGTGLRAYYADPEDSDDANLMVEDGEWALEHFNSWLGEMKDRLDLTVILAPRSKGGGYARPGFIVIQAMDRKSFFHELAHLWWVGAPVDSWEDWLNEAFAEYSAVRAMGIREGQESFEESMEEKRNNARGLPAIRGLPRTHEKAWTVLYHKGAMLLHDLELTIGEEAFTRLLQLRVEEGINSTEGFLALLAQVAGQEQADEFSRQLDS